MKAILYISILLMLVSCKKPENRSCWKSKGKLVTEQRSYAEFNRLELYDGIDYVFIQDSLNYISITTGENLINFIESEVVDQTLVIRDENKCDFLRDFPVKVIVEIHYTKIVEVYNESYGTIEGVISLPDEYFQWDNWEGATRISLELDLDTAEFAMHTGAPEFIGSGTANVILLFTSGFCHIDCTDLIANNGQAHNSGLGDIRIRVDNGWLKCIVEDFGDVYYTGENFTLGIQDRGEGDIIYF